MPINEIELVTIQVCDRGMLLFYLFSLTALQDFFRVINKDNLVNDLALLFGVSWLACFVIDSF